MLSVEELRDRLRKPLQMELRNGCRDDVVVGGIEKLVESVGRPFADVREVFSGYRQLDSASRHDRIERALELLAPVGEERVSDAVGPAPATPSSRGEPKSPAKRDPSVLDAELRGREVDLGAHAARKLGEIGIRCYRHLLHYYPRRYEDRRALPHFGVLGERQSATVVGTITGRKAVKSRSGMTVLRVFLEDVHGGHLTAIWFNQPWLEKQFFPEQRIFLSGRVKRRGRHLEMNVSHFEIDEEGEPLSSDRIVGIYPNTRGLSQAYIRRSLHRLLTDFETFPDHLPRSVLDRFELVSLDTALRSVHLPDSERSLQRALRRLKFDEFLFLELRLLLNRDTTLLGRRFEVRQTDLDAFAESLPFALTGAQERALREILDDMATPRQMARLLQGDVGSGKTAVAAAAIYVTVQNGTQAALMAPTEILARQHFLNLAQYLYPLGVTSELLIGTMTLRERQEARNRVCSGEAQVAVGTHALIQEGVQFRDLGLAVIDEEHRFGVEQRRKLLRGLPDVVVMSATPIPRSLALTYYGDLELSIIDELPPGRKPVATRLVNDSRRREVYRFAWGEIQKGRQVYLVTPLIEESEALGTVVSTTQMFEDLCALMPPQVRIEILHGKMPGQEKDGVMERFRRHEFDLLVSTTVVEVGVDIPNASLMIIENAERFGLSQLHQLRGRVGRGKYESYCILVAGDRSKKTQHRLEVVEEHRDGFVIAEKDLALRGPGELRGTRQSGLPDLVLGDLVKDGEIIEKSRDLAKRMLETDPKLEAVWADRLRAELKRRSSSVGFREII